MFFGALAETKAALDVFNLKVVEHKDSEEKQVLHLKALLAIAYGELNRCVEFLSDYKDESLNPKHRRVRELLATYKTYFLQNESEIMEISDIKDCVGLVKLVIDYVSDFHTLLHEDTHGNKRNAIVRKTKEGLLDDAA